MPSLAAEINIAGNSYSSSLLPMTQHHLSADPSSATVGTQDVKVITVADLVAGHGVTPERCLLKVDTQGFERSVLDGAGDLMDRFAAVQLELSFVELYEGQQLYEELVQELGRPRSSFGQLRPAFLTAPDGFCNVTGCS